ncbi:MAG: glycine betaine ABC transporter substrate-binding protein [Rhodospirillales bacterium]
MKFKRTLAAAAAVLGFTVTAPAMAADMGAKNEPIKMALFEWDGQQITTYIAGAILEEMGYKVEYVTAGYWPSATAVADGGIHVGMELWDNNLGDFYPGMIDEGKVERIGDTGLDANEGFLYTKSFESKCSGLPAWSALLKCSKELAAPETYPKGRILAYPADWGTRTADMIAGENIDFVAIPGGSDGAMVVEMQAALNSGTPLVMLFWGPHWIQGGGDTGWIDMPDSVKNKYGFQKPTTFNVVWPGFKNKWPAAYEFLKDWRISNDIQLPLISAAHNEGQKAQALSEYWVRNNKGMWMSVVDKARM